MDILKIKKNHLFVSRGATGIYLILVANNFKNRMILLPANICYAAVYPVLYAGYTPIFCDVDENTGNVTYEIIEKYGDSVSAMILPHMYGNPIPEIESIAEFCKKKNIILIEDCASAMGAGIKGKLCGSWGDYALFSTGYSKTIDIGSGGIVLTDCEVQEMEKCYRLLPVKNELDEMNDAFFSKIYRLIRNNNKQTISQYIWNGLRDNLKTVYIHRDEYIADKIDSALGGLNDIVKRRRAEVNIYRESLKQNSYYKIYKYCEGAVPWRFSLLVEPEIRRRMIEYLLEHHVPVSDWYPVVTPIFGVENHFAGASAMESKIVNFPLMIEKREIRKICQWVNEF